jgi:hypothetical protein
MGSLGPQHELITQKFAADTIQITKHHNTDAKKTSTPKPAA